jgi:signal transduction histidine kinase
MRAVATLAGGIAHRFNNLLTGILGNASLLMEEIPSDTRCRELISEIMAASTRAAELTAQLLAYSGRGQVVVERVAVNQLIRQMRDMLRASIRGKIELRLELTPEPLFVLADAAQLQQTILNLAVNAGEAIRDLGVVTVRTSKSFLSASDIARQEGFEALTPGEYAIVEVIDTGSGIDETTRARIFDPFFSTKFPGRGLGLAAVAGIARSHKGAVQVSSTPGEGSAFRVYLPSV